MSRAPTSEAKLEQRAAIGARLRQLRRHRYGMAATLRAEYVGGFTETADLLGVSIHTYRNWETGKPMPIECVLTLLLRTGVSPQWLLDGTGPEFTGAAGPAAVRERRNLAAVSWDD
jgi:transcriptional regulator with XRE-family HTH domain